MLLNGTKTNLTFVPRGNNVVLERLVGGDVTEGGIHIPPRYVENPLMGKVLAVGPGKEIPHSERQEISDEVEALAVATDMDTYELLRFERIYGIEVGDIVFFNIKAAVPCERDPNSRMCVVDADYILAVVKQGE